MSPTTQSAPAATLRVMAATEKSLWTDWREIWSTTRLSIGEPRLDDARWQQEGILSIYLQDKPPIPGTPSPLRVIDLHP